MFKYYALPTRDTTVCRYVTGNKYGKNVVKLSPIFELYTTIAVSREIKVDTHDKL